MKGVFVLKKERPFVPDPEPADETLFDCSSLASATEFTGMGRAMPIFPNDSDGLPEGEDAHIQPGKLKKLKKPR